MLFIRHKKIFFLQFFVMQVIVLIILIIFNLSTILFA
jgi:hypothetical protein